MSEKKCHNIGCMNLITNGKIRCEDHLKQNREYQYRRSHPNVINAPADTAETEVSQERRESITAARIQATSHTEVESEKRTETTGNSTVEFSREVTRNTSCLTIEVMTREIRTKAIERSKVVINNIRQNAFASTVPELQKLRTMHSEEKCRELLIGFESKYPKGDDRVWNDRYDHLAWLEQNHDQKYRRDMGQEIKALGPPGCMNLLEHKVALNDINDQAQVSLSMRRELLMGHDLAILVAHDELNPYRFRLEQIYDHYLSEIPKSEILVDQFRPHHSNDEELRKKIMQQPKKYEYFVHCVLNDVGLDRETTVRVPAYVYHQLWKTRETLGDPSAVPHQKEFLSEANAHLDRWANDKKFHSHQYPEGYLECEPFIEQFSKLYDDCERVQWKPPTPFVHDEIGTELQSFEHKHKMLIKQRPELAEFFPEKYTSRLKNYLDMHYRVWDSENERPKPKRRVKVVVEDERIEALKRLKKDPHNKQLQDQMMFATKIKRQKIDQTEKARQADDAANWMN